MHDSINSISNRYLVLGKNRQILKVTPEVYIFLARNMREGSGRVSVCVPVSVPVPATSERNMFFSSKKHEGREWTGVCVCASVSVPVSATPGGNPPCFLFDKN